MKAQIVITLDGQIQVVTQEGTYEGGKLAIEKLLARLNAQGLKIELTGPVEQHRHDDPAQVRGHVHSH
jgi:hypothetical protein